MTTPEALARKVLGVKKKARNQGSSAVTRLRKQAVTAGVMIAQEESGKVAHINLQGFNALSWQVFWRGSDHRVRTAAKRAYVQPIVHALETLPRAITQHDEPITLDVQVYGRGNLVDPENVCVKPITDELVRHGVLRNDTLNEIAELRVKVRRSAEPYPYMLITLEAA